MTILVASFLSCVTLQYKRRAISNSDNDNDSDNDDDDDEDDSNSDSDHDSDNHHKALTNLEMV